MGLDYSQKQLLARSLKSKSPRLRLYAVLTGGMSLLISLVSLLITVAK